MQLQRVCSKSNTKNYGEWCVGVCGRVFLSLCFCLDSTSSVFTPREKKLSEKHNRYNRNHLLHCGGQTQKITLVLPDFSTNRTYSRFSLNVSESLTLPIKLQEICMCQTEPCTVNTDTLRFTFDSYKEKQ